MDGSIPSLLASAGHRTVVASVGFLWWVTSTEGGIMRVSYISCREDMVRV